MVLDIFIDIMFLIDIFVQFNTSFFIKDRLVAGVDPARVPLPRSRVLPLVAQCPA